MRGRDKEKTGLSLLLSLPSATVYTHIVPRFICSVINRSCNAESPILPLIIINNQRLLIIKPKLPHSLYSRSFGIFKGLLDYFCVHSSMNDGGLPLPAHYCQVAPSKKGYRINGNIGRLLTDSYLNMRSQKSPIKGKDSLTRILFKATRLLFKELLKKFARRKLQK